MTPFDVHARNIPTRCSQRSDGHFARGFAAMVAGVGLSCLLTGCFPTQAPQAPPTPDALKVQHQRRAGSPTQSSQPAAQTSAVDAMMTLFISPLWAQVKANGKLVGVVSYLPSGATGIRLKATQAPLKLLVQKPGYTDWKRTLGPAEQRAAQRGKLGAFALAKRSQHKRYKSMTRSLARHQRAVARNPRSHKLRKRYQRALVRAGRYRRALDHIAAWRRWMPRSAALLKQHVALQRRFSRAKARRLLSEWTEFAPQDPQTWLTYGRHLRKQKQFDQSCDAFIKVIHLNPTATSLFQGIMAMRRQRGANASSLKRCILKGVRQMPIERKLTIAMMWDQDKTDIDMWVTEPDGEEVGFQHKQSRSGGVLYYDVTTGYGPEIYVNAQKPGRYRLRAVYYGGSAAQVKVAFTILKHAGTKRLSTIRKTITLTPNTRRQKQHVAWINVSE